MLLLFSMFAFAAVFHVVTRQGELLPAHFDAQLAAFAGAIDAESPTLNVGEVAQRLQASVAPMTLMLESIAAYEPPAAMADAPAIERPALIAASAWPPVPAQATAARATLTSTEDGAEAGAVTRALSTTRTALRQAFKKAF